MNTTNARPRQTRRLIAPAIVIATLLVAGAAGVAAAQGASGERMRLVLDDTTIDVIGPVQRDGALLTFRTLDGMLGSIQVRRVARVVSLATGRSESPAPRVDAPSSAPRTPLPPGRGGQFSNADLPPGDAPAGAGGAITNRDLADDTAAPVVTRGAALTNADLPAGAEPDGDAPDPERAALDEVLATLESPGRPGAPSLAPIAPAEPAPDALALEIELAAIEEEIAAAEVEENTYYRLMVCVQHGISPRSPDCTPRLQPRPSVAPSVTERSLAAKVRDAGERVEAAQAARAALIERARAAGIAIEATTAP